MQPRNQGWFPGRPWGQGVNEGLWALELRVARTRLQKGRIFQRTPVIEGYVNKVPPNSVLNAIIHFYVSQLHGSVGLRRPFFLSGGGGVSTQPQSESSRGCGQLP